MSRQQQWAQAAFEAVTAAKGQTALKIKYATHCMKTPSLLLTSGLVQTTAFLRSRKDPAAPIYLDDLARALGKSDGKALDDAARKADTMAYLRLSRDALHVATWLRRFCQSEMPKESEAAATGDDA